MYFIHYSNYKYVKTPRILTRRDHAPGFKIPESATVLDLKPTDFDHVNFKNGLLT